MVDSPKQFMKRLFGFSIGPVISAIIGFITVPLTTYFISPDEFGKASMFTMAYSISALFIFLGMDQAFVREFNSEEDKKSLFWNSLIIPLGFSVILAVLYLVFYKPISILLFDSVEPYTIKLLALLLPFAIIDRFNMLVIRMQEKARLYSYLNIISKVVNTIVLLIFIIFDRSFKSVVNSTVVSIIVVCFIEIFFNLEYWKINFKLKMNWKLVKRMFYFGLPLVPASIISWLFNSMDKIAMRNWSNFEQIGLYSAAFKVVMILGIIQQAFSTFWVPTAYRWHENNADISEYIKVSKLLTNFMSVIFVFIILFRELIIKMLSSTYSGAAVSVPFLLFYPLMYTISETTTLGIGFSRKTGYNIVISLVSVIVNFIGNYLLVPKYGALGASISTGLAYVVFFWMRTLISRRLWQKFDVSFYFWNILFMLVMAFTNIKYDNIYLNILFAVIVLVYNKEIFVYALTEGKKILKNKKEF